MATKTEDKEKSAAEKKREKYSDSILDASSDHERYFQEVFAEVDFEIKLYRFADEKKGLKLFLHKYINEIPDEERIGLEYGGGRYFALGINPVTDKIYSKNINIDETFSELKRERDREAQEEKKRQAILTGQPYPQQQTDPVLLMKEFFTMISPLFETLAKAQAKPPPQQENIFGEAIPKVITGAAGIFTNAFKTMSDNFMRAQQDLIDQNREGETSELGPDDPKTKILETVVDFVKAFGTKLIDSKGDGLVNTLKSDPQIQQLIKDKDLLSMVYSSCAHDKTIGKKRIDGIFKKLNVEVPA